MTPPVECEVAFPELRTELQYALAALADEEYQRRVWIEGIAPRTPYAYDFDMACHAILDDTDVLRDPTRLLGTVLRDDSELRAVVGLASALQAVISDIGAAGTISAARSSPAWPDLVASAAQASQLLGRPDPFP